MQSRRQFIKNIGVVSLAGLLSSVACQKTQRPLKNVICIIGDDHATHSLGCYGNDLVKTPNLDKLAQKSARFTHAYANAPVCSASRQSLLTGLYPHASGVTLLQTPFSDDQITIAEHLKTFGFKTGVIGKTHFNNDLPHGFDVRKDTREWRQHLQDNPPEKPPETLEHRPVWKPFRTPARTWLNADGLPSEFYDKDDLGTFLANESASFIRENKDDRFCLWVGFHEPHSPFNFPIEYRNKYNPNDISLPPVSDEDDRWIPAIFKDLTDDDKKGIIASCYTSVEYMDKNVGIILDELEKQGITDETLVIYIGDQGYLLGHHKRFEKHMMWEEAIKSPLIIRPGNRYHSEQEIGPLCEFVDLAPTVTDLLGVKPMKQIQGKSLASLLDGKTSVHKDYVFSEFLVDNKAMIRTDEWKYIFTSGKRDLGQGYATGNGPSGLVHRLYNVVTDPHEHYNVANKKGNAEILKKMQNLMLTHFENTHPKAEKLPKGLSLDEKLSWFCIPPEGNKNIDAR